MKKFLLLLAVIMITFTVSAQTGVVDIRMIKSVTLENGRTTKNTVDFRAQIDKKLSTVILYDSDMTIKLTYTADDYFEKDGYVSMSGTAVDHESREEVGIQIDFSQTDNYVIISLSTGDMSIAYIGKSY